MHRHLRIALLSFSLFLYSSVSKANGTDSIQVYIFLSETCPICQNSSLSLRSVYKEFKDSGISFTGVFPNINMSSSESLAHYGRKYKLDFPLILDHERKLTQQLGATHTPQVYVLRISDQMILYKGKIDNTYEALGKKRQVVTEQYLRLTLQQILANQDIDPSATIPLGCYILK
ncbi:MAG: redoxin domain-containing protein [Saprospiraceae bacterium]